MQPNNNRHSKLFTWIFSHDSNETASLVGTKEVQEETVNNDNYYCSQKLDLEIPNRRQSHLYTPYHQQQQIVDTSDTVSLDTYQYKRRSYLPPSNNESSSSLTRSATWQPSSSQQQNTHNLKVDDIPTRRTSRNYSDNPEIQAKLNAVLNSDKISHIIQQQQQRTNYPLSKQN